MFNWYREQIALKYFLQGNDSLINFKPVILFRSKTIEASRKDYAEFLDIIKNLKTSDFDFLNDIISKVDEGETIYEQGKSKTLDMLEFIKRENISYTRIVEKFKEIFAEKNCIITNSKVNYDNTI